MAVRQNQGFRRDLNFEENTNDVQALSNLGGVGIAGDLRIMQNNLRNQSKLPFNNIDNGFFVFDVDKVISINSITSSVSQSGNSTEVEVTLVQEYDIESPNVIVVSGVTGTGSTVYNGEFVTTLSSDNGLKHKFVVEDVQYSGSASGSDVSGATFTFEPKSEFVFTNGDVVKVSKDVNTGSVNLLTTEKYYVCNSDTVTKFKLSTTPPSSGLSIVTVSSISDSTFSFLRLDEVTQENLINYIQPDIQDDEEFGSYLTGPINDVFENTQQKLETSDYLVTKKYKGTDDTETTEEIKIEGTVTLSDPGNYNTTDSALGNAKSPGMFIRDTRAFSSDNNPWAINGSDLETDSHEVDIGELFFADNITVTGIGTDYASGTEVDVTLFTHKVPVTINSETYYLLLST
jgi:hypothetical protein